MCSVASAGTPTRLPPNPLTRAALCRLQGRAWCTGAGIAGSLNYRVVSPSPSSIFPPRSQVCLPLCSSRPGILLCPLKESASGRMASWRNVLGTRMAESSQPAGASGAECSREICLQRFSCARLEVPAILPAACSPAELRSSFRGMTSPTISLPAARPQSRLPVRGRTSRRGGARWRKADPLLSAIVTR